LSSINKRLAAGLMDSEQRERIALYELENSNADRSEREFAEFSRRSSIELSETERFRRMFQDRAVECSEKSQSKHNLKLTKELEEQERYRRIMNDVISDCTEVSGRRDNVKGARDAADNERLLRVLTEYLRPAPEQVRNMFIQ